MARIRTIKPQFWQDEDLATLDAETRLLAIGLLNHCDDEGYFRAHPALIKSVVFPFSDHSVNIQDMLISLSKVNYLNLFDGSNGKRYGKVLNFVKHQRVNRPSPSEIKAYEQFSEDSVSDHGDLTAGKERKGKEGKGKELCSNQGSNETNEPNQEQFELGSNEPEQPNLKKAIKEKFNTFWSEYPRKQKKQTAQKSWLKQIKSPEHADQVIQHVITRKQNDPQWLKDAGQFIPLATTFLNQSLWEDEYETIRPVPSAYEPVPFPEIGGQHG